MRKGEGVVQGPGKKGREESSDDESESEEGNWDSVGDEENSEGGRMKMRSLMLMMGGGNMIMLILWKEIQRVMMRVSPGTNLRVLKMRMSKMGIED